jgi:hypothetical protein
MSMSIGTAVLETVTACLVNASGCSLALESALRSLFFSRKEAKALALRGSKLGEVDAGGQGQAPRKNPRQDEIFFSRKEGKV